MFSLHFHSSLCYAIALLAPVFRAETADSNVDSAFWNAHFTYPKVHHAIDKREIHSSRESEESGKHLDHLSVSINLHGIDRKLDLKLNRNLIPKQYVEKHQTDEGYVLNKPKPEDVELCHYNGEIRDVLGSWVAVSTCDGISGILYDGNEILYVERASRFNSSNPLDGMHVVYKHSDLKSNFTCGFHDHSSHATTHHNSATVGNRRVRRNTDALHGPYNSNKLSRYIELVLVADTSLYKAFNQDVHRVHRHAKNLANIINSLYAPLNIFVALVGVVIWTKQDEIGLEKNGDKTLNNFLAYRKNKLTKELHNDNAQFLTRVAFDDGVVGKGLKGPICTSEYSGGVNVDHSNVVGLVATTIAHEMGHNLGMEHDTEKDCKCPAERCIMAPSSSSFSPTDWSSCSREYLAVAFEHGMDYCLRNKPTSLFDGPVCGNDFVESGEQCDCGLKESCDNPCCNATTCTLNVNATCATGECCDFQTCQPRTAGTQCRSAEHECDLPEYCTGNSEYCPNDVFKIDGESCNGEKAYCYQGCCRSHDDQCQVLWGPTGENSVPECYASNEKGDHNGNCGYNWLNQSYVKCRQADIKCGLLKCVHFNEKLEFGMESAAKLSQTFVSSDVKGIQISACRTAMVDLGANEVDPGLVPDGAKCGEDHMCYKQRCMSIGALRTMIVPNACPENCNGNGICNSKGHCHCNKGYEPPDCYSWGNGGSEDSGPAENPHNYRTLRTVFYYLMLTIVPVVLVLAAYSYYIRKSPSYFWKRNQRRTIQKSVQVHVNHDDRHNNGLGSTVQSLLSSTTRSVGQTTADENGRSSLHDTLIGSFKGFSIMPLMNHTKVDESVPAKAAAPVRPAPPPIHSIPVATVRPITTTTTTTGPLRPLISSPVLDKTTSSTVNQLINKNYPVRPAPPVPFVATHASPSPMSCVLEETQKAPASVRPPPPKEANSTLSRIASFVAKPHQSSSKTEAVKKEGVPSKAAKIDKDTLKNLVISHPIPLNEPSIPVNPLPLSSDQQRCVVMRAQSLRQAGNKQRPGIPSFGSVRLSQSQRPSSIPSCSRPTSPPPCPPSACTSPVPTTTSDESEDNIYAIIEESPTDEEHRESAFDTSPLKRPAVLGDSDGLLNEIVNEMKARNIESIYANDVIRKGPSDRLYENTSPASEYLKPKTIEEVRPTECKSYPSPLKVPEANAPSYKPSSARTNPIATPSVSKDNEVESSQASSAPRSSAAKPAPLTAKPVIKPNLLPKTKIVSQKSDTGPGRSYAGIPKTSMVASMQRKFEARSSPSAESTDKDSASS